jgi:hypothetical protein
VSDVARAAGVIGCVMRFQGMDLSLQWKAAAEARGQVNLVPTGTWHNSTLLLVPRSGWYGHPGFGHKGQEAQ